MDQVYEMPCQLMTGSTLAATFGRGRHRGFARIGEGRLQFVDKKGATVYDEPLSDISDLNLTKLGVLHITSDRTVKIFIDGSEFNMVSDSAFDDVTIAMKSRSTIKELHQNLLRAWEGARGQK